MLADVIVVLLVLTFLHLQPKVDLFHCHLSTASTLCPAPEVVNPLKTMRAKKDRLQNEGKDDFIKGMQLSQNMMMLNQKVRRSGQTEQPVGGTTA